MLRGERAGADRLVDALDLRHVEAARAVADQHAARHLEPRNRLPSARSNGARPRGEYLASLEQRLDAAVMLELLERLERRQTRVLVIQADDEAHVDAIVVEMVDEAAAIGARVERPAEAVLNESGLRASGRQLPQLLHAEPVRLWARARIQCEAADQLLREAAAGALGDHRRARANIGSRCVVRSGLAVLLQPHVAQPDPNQ